MTFPDSLVGQKVFITVVFSKGGQYQKAQNQSLGWQGFWQSELKDQGIPFYEIPMVSAGYRIMSGVLDGWMRDGIDPALHDFVATHYGSKQKYADALGVTDLTDCYVCLLDEEGNILLNQFGSISEEKKRGFLELIDKN